MSYPLVVATVGWFAIGGLIGSGGVEAGSGISRARSAAATGVWSGMGQVAPQEGRAADVTRGASITAYVLTAEPGDAVWERFGHNAIRIVDSSDGSDITWNWGIFQFGSGFVARFLQGTMRYSMVGERTAGFLASHRAAGRAVWAQEIELSPEQRWELRRDIELNALDPFYRYDYYRDNCSTRVRDMLDAVLGGRIHDQIGAQPSGTTYRDHTRRLLQVDPLAYTGTLLVLGQGIDRPITAWEEAFLPLRLRSHLASLTVVRDGEELPLVRSEQLLVAPSGRPPVPASVPDWFLFFLLIGMGWVGAMVFGVRLMPRHPFLGRSLTLLSVGCWALVAGASGVFMALGWVLTDHVFVASNENILQANPLALVVAIGLIPWLLGRPLPKWVKTSAYLVAAGSVLGAVLQPLPGLDQVNGEIVAITVLPNLAMAWVANELWRASPTFGS